MYVTLGCFYKIFTALIVSLIFLLSSFSYGFANSEGSITATVSISICGNGVVEYAEVCDSTIINGKTCADFGYQKGILLCGFACDEYNTDYCFNEPEEKKVEDFIQQAIEDEYEFDIEVKQEEVFDSAEVSNIEIITVNDIESTEYLSSGYSSPESLSTEIYYREVPLSRAPT